ncbi:MAG: RHS repeat-associated core domain-containing protein, partial [Thermoanaerobaculia bacterium]
LITRASGYSAGYHVYYPFGEEATAFNQDTERMKFTGHERDLASPAGAGDDLDYMHARFCSPLTGRFLSVDPLNSAKAKFPQGWNKYVYVEDNPIKYLDTNGRELRLGLGAEAQALNATRLMLPPALRNAVNVGNNAHGQRVVTVNNSVRSNDQLFKNLQRVANSPGVVEMNFVSTATQVDIALPNGGTASRSVGSINDHGFTLPSRGTAIGNEPARSPAQGVTRVYVVNSLPQDQQAATVAAELGAHALPAILGLGAAPGSEAEHHLREDPLVQAARANAQQPP